MKEESNIYRNLIKRLEDIGRCRQILDQLHRHDAFDDLSKHNYFFHSEHQEESDRLNQLRTYLGDIKDQINEISEILDNEIKENPEAFSPYGMVYKPPVYPGMIAKDDTIKKESNDQS